MQMILIVLLIVLPVFALGQSETISGSVLSDTGDPLPYSTAVLLDPADSTLQYFGITDVHGDFSIGNINKGSYLLQIAFLGYETYYKKIDVPLDNSDNPGIVIMKPKQVMLDEVDIVSEHIPLIIKQDTIEYNAGAFKVKPDAVTEDLLKKLPGFEVDRSGNIKALGEDVEKVLVDGKEFFGNDPKVATRNLPADALNKVQVFDRRSDESEFSGIDDGVRDKSLNLVLKDDKKEGIFGDITAGAGTGNHYKGSAKVYRFSEKMQLAALGMLNNINEYGFSFNDYLNFSGGISALSGGSGSVVIGMDEGIPVNFGQPVTGKTTSGAGGLNFSFSKSKFKRVFFSYLVNGYEKQLDETTSTWNYTPEDSYFQDKVSSRNQRNFSHRLNFGWRNRIDSTQNIILNGNIGYSNGKIPSSSKTTSYHNDRIINTLISDSRNETNRLSGNLNISYQNKINRNNTVLKIKAALSGTKDHSKILFDNTTLYYNPPLEDSISQYQDLKTDRLDYNFSAYLTQRLKGLFYIEPRILGGQSFELLDRTQGIPLPDEIKLDSLSPEFIKQKDWLRPGIGFKRNTDKTHFSINLSVELGQFSNTLWNDEPVMTRYLFPTPVISYENDYKTGRRFSVMYLSRVNTPTVSQLQPVVDNINPLTLVYGNRNLKPEYIHSVNFHWLLFDQFSFTSVLASLNTTYTLDKINWSREVNNQLEQTMTLTNVDDDFRIGGNIDFSTPIKKLGVKINTTLDESYNRGINMINGVENVNTNWIHRLSLSIDNRKKDKWDVITGAAVKLTDAKYSVEESLNDRYYDVSWYAEIRYNPNDSWNFMISADITNYYSESFDQQVNIPLLTAEVSYYFLKNKRGVFTLYGFDLLNKNTGIERISEMNYLMEKQSNTIGRYVMLSFKYRLNKFGNKGSGFHVDINRR